MYLLHMTEGVDKYRQSMNQGTTDKAAEDKAIDYVFKLLDIPWWYYAIALVIGEVVWWRIRKKLIKKRKED